HRAAGGKIPCVARKNPRQEGGEPMAQSKGYRPLYLPPVPQDAPDSGRVVLRDGSTATLRVARPEDKPLVADFVRRLSEESRLRRFFSAGVAGEEVLMRTRDSPDPSRQLTLVVLRG